MQVVDYQFPRLGRNGLQIAFDTRGRRIGKLPNAAGFPMAVGHVRIGGSIGVVERLQRSVQHAAAGGQGQIGRFDHLDVDGPTRREQQPIGRERLGGQFQHVPHSRRLPRSTGRTAAPQPSRPHQHDANAGHLAADGLDRTGAADVLEATAVDPPRRVHDQVIAPPQRLDALAHHRLHLRGGRGSGFRQVGYRNRPDPLGKIADPEPADLIAIGQRSGAEAAVEL